MLYIKKIPKLIWLVLAAICGPFVPGLIVALYNTFFEADIDGADKMGAHAWGLFWTWAKTYAPAHWDRLLWFSAIIVCCWVSWTHGRHFLVVAWKRRLILKRVGIRAYLPRDTEKDKKDSWADCVKFLTHEGNDIICLSGANGWDTFGRPKSPLSSVLKQFRGPQRILLLHPFSDALTIRAASITETEERYRKNIFKSINACRVLKKQGRDIEVRLFDWPPVWKMIFSTDRLWLQHYEDGRHVEHTPVYSFGRDPNPSSLYHPFRSEFQRMWDRADKVNLNLGSEVLERMLLAQKDHRCAQCDGSPAGLPGPPAPNAAQ